MMNSTPTIDADLPCVGCGYNIRGQATDRRCPECDRRVMETLGYQAHGESLDSIRHGLVGVGWVVLGIALMLALGTVAANFTQWVPLAIPLVLPMLFFLFVAVIRMAMLAFGEITGLLGVAYMRTAGGGLIAVLGISGLLSIGLAPNEPRRAGAFVLAAVWLVSLWRFERYAGKRGVRRVREILRLSMILLALSVVIWALQNGRLTTVLGPAGRFHAIVICLAVGLAMQGLGMILLGRATPRCYDSSLSVQK